MTDDAQTTPAPTEPSPLEPVSAQEPMQSAADVAPTAPTPEVIPEVPQSSPVPQTPPPSPSAPAEDQAWSPADRAHAAATHARKKDARLSKIIEYAHTHGPIRNDDIEKLLHVSDATASRYAKMLVARGVLRPEGKGRGARYVLAP